jgi:WD40 repeat protein
MTFTATAELTASLTPTSATVQAPPTAAALPAVVLSPLQSLQLENQWIRSLAWAPDSSRFAAATGGGNALIAVGNPELPRWVFQTPIDAANVRQVAWSPNGATLAIAEGEGRQMFSLLDAATGMPQTVFEESSAACVAWSPDGQLLAVGTDDGDIALWKSETDEIVYTLDTGTSDIDSAAWSLDGTRIAAAVAGDVIVWSWDGSQHERLLTIQDAGEKVSWSPDGTLLATEGRHGGIWNAATGERLFDLADAILPAWSPDSVMIATNTGKDVTVLGAKTGAPLFSIPGHARSIETVAWSPDGTMIVSGDGNGLVIVWGD